MIPRHRTLGFTTLLSAIIQSPVWSEIRGSIGGTTYARNKSGLYARNRSIPVNPNTVNQSLVRSRLSTLAMGFSTLTAPQVASWNQFAQGYPAKNKLGDSYTPTGKQVYMLCNLNLMSIGLGAISAPPYDVPVVPGINTEAAVLTAEVDTGEISALSFDGVTSDNPTAVFVVQLTPTMQAARQSYRNRMRQLHFGADADLPFDLKNDYLTYFGTLNATIGQVINLRVSAVDVDSGVASSWMYVQATLVVSP